MCVGSVGNITLNSVLVDKLQCNYEKSELV